MLAKSLAAAFGLLAVSTAALAQDADNPVAATVDGTEILRSDVEAVKNSLPDQMRNAPIEQLYPVLLDRTIDFKLLEIEAEKLSIGDEPELQAALAQARAAVMRDFMLRKKVEDGSTDEALKARYEELKKDEGFSFEEVHARHILLASEEDAKAVIAELADGANFEELAKEKSTGPSAPNGGDLGYFKKGAMVPEFGDAAFSMEPGSTSQEPVQTQFGFHVIKVEDKRTTEPSFEETEPQIRQDVAREIVTALVEGLREGATIERFNLDGSPMTAEGEGESGSGG
jgi:peptidyl-prolyl cis-trans isomerase C